MSSPAVENYPGNPSLPREVREKILSTFRHTLNLFHQGKTDDCLIGCDFILKMDPRFGPARKLMDKAKNPAAAVDVAELEAVVTATPTRQERVAAVDPDRLLVRAVESFNARDFDAAIAAAQQVLSVLPGNRDALEILDKAAGKKAAQPLFDASRQRALAALENNRQDEARRELDRMRGLDPDHPAVVLLERKLGVSPAAAPPREPVQAAPSDDDINFDLSIPEPPHVGFGSETREPEIHFDSGATVSLNLGAPPPPSTGPAGLDSLSLDALSLDASEPAAVPPPPKFDGDATNPGATRVPAPPPPPPRGSPADLWSSSAGGGLDLEPEPVGGPVRGPEPPPPPAAPIPPLAPLEEEDTRANEQEIEALLRQGDEVATRGDRQQAIEIWSRIFLIDINNTEAVNRIEQARQEMAEGNRTIAECLKTGREKFEAGDYSGARELFLQVLAVDENEPTARFYIDRIEEELARGRGEAAPKDALSAAAPAAASGSMAGSAPAPMDAHRRSGLRIPPRVLALVGVALLASAGGAYLVFKTPKPGPAASATGAAARGSLARARELAAAGKTAEAQQELQRVARSSPEYAQARKMLAELGSAASTTAAPGPAVAALPTAPAIDVMPASTPGPNDPSRLRSAGEKALTEKHYIEALKNFNLASPSFRNDPTFAQELGVASDKVTALAPAVKLYNEAEYETAIPIFWRIYQEDRENQDARSYLLRSYYNQGITQLQNQLYEKAIQSFDEALALDGTDTEAIRHRKFAEHYRKGDLDLMGRIYVRHLNRRP
jgi:tetratricopeptide (TPR) repeat protein